MRIRLCSSSFTASIPMALFASTCLCASSLAEPQTYRVDDLGPGWSGSAMNNRGDACGNFSPDGTALLAGFSRNGRPFELLPLPEGMQTSRASDINDRGVIVGAVCPNQFVITQPIAAVWHPVGDGYEVEILGTYSTHPYSAAWAINNLGDIIGGSGHFGWSLTTGLLFDEGGPTILPGGIRASDINDARVLVSGNVLTELDTGLTTEIPLPPGNWQGFASNAINNSNDVCGHVIGFSGCSTFPIRYRQGIGWEFLGGCATTTSATAINDHGDALLYYYTTVAGVDFTDHGFYAIGSLIDPSQGTWFVQWGGAIDINKNHQILSSARRGATGPIGAIRMSPIYLPCPADIDGDGELTLFDFLRFQNLFAMGDPAADFDGDGTLTIFDFLAFQNAFAIGCP